MDANSNDFFFTNSIKKINTLKTNQCSIICLVFWLDKQIQGHNKIKEFMYNHNSGTALVQIHKMKRDLCCRQCFNSKRMTTYMYHKAGFLDYTNPMVHTHLFKHHLRN